jgi:hypothetical protein
MMSNLPLRNGMAPSAFESYVNSSKMAGVKLSVHPKLRLVQTMGTAVKASAGYHARDGYVTYNGKRIAYCAAFDSSVTWLEIGEIKAWLNAMAWFGIAAWYRPWTTNGKPNFHIHGIYAGLPMKPQLDRQVADFLNDRTGLAGHGRETFFTGNKQQDHYIRSLWIWANKGGPRPIAPPKAIASALPPDYHYLKAYRLIVGGNLFANPKTGKPYPCPAIDGTAWIPARPFYEQALGITKWENPDSGRVEEAVKWHPVQRLIYVQSRAIKYPVKLLQIAGVRQGYLPVREVAEFSGLRLTVDESTRDIRLDRVAAT